MDRDEGRTQEPEVSSLSLQGPWQRDFWWL